MDVTALENELNSFKRSSFKKKESRPGYFKQIHSSSNHDFFNELKVISEQMRADKRTKKMLHFISKLVNQSTRLHHGSYILLPRETTWELIFFPENLT